MNKEDYSKYYIKGSDHYLIPKDVFNELFNEMVNWKEESKELKQKYENAVADYETTMFEKVKLERQQKKFIEWLEDEIIEEPKKIKKISRCDDVKMTHYGELYKPTENQEILRIKVNELIDEINKLKKANKL